MTLRRLVAFAFLLLIALPLVAETTASLRGVVTRNSAPVAGAVVTVASPALQGTRTATTSENGAYDFAALPPGQYDLSIVDGARVVKLTVTLRLAETTEADVPLYTETLVVVPASALDTPAVTTNLTLREIDLLPVQRNQNASSQLAPGVAASTFGQGQLAISGGPTYDNLVLVNGVAVTENVVGQMRPMYVEDAIEETTLLTAAVPAEYGRFTGGVVNTITKSGGNDYSGSLRDSLSNAAWVAQSPLREARVNSLNHVWEGTLGGFVLRDWLWFFGAGRRARNDMARQTIPVPPFTGNPASSASPRLDYTEGNDQKRYEAKVTAQITARHNVTGSYFSVDTQGTNTRFTNNIYDAASLTTRDDPESLRALRYDGFFAQQLLIEAQFSRRTFAFESSGSQFTDLIRGTVVFDRANANARFNSPTLCAVCENEHRDNEDVMLKASYSLDTATRGSHRLTAGAERFREQRLPNSHQSGSDFTIFATRVQYANGNLYPVFTPTTPNGGGTFLRWNPIVAAARENDLRTDSLFLDDRWDLGARWSFSLGARYDRNHAVDADGIVRSDDSRLSPRLTVHFDPRGDGRQRISASFADYSSRIADSIASSNQIAGNAAAIDFAYKGPAINDKALNTSLPDAIRILFDAFNGAQGGTGNTTATNLRTGGLRTVPGYATYFDDSLASPYVRELTAGYGFQFSADGFAKLDLIKRDWRNFYAASVTTSTKRASTPLGLPVDLALYRNSDAIDRTYRGAQLQLRYNPRRFQSGVFYTYSKLRGNDEGENATAGAVANVDTSSYYPQFLDYARYAPDGYLPGDQRHRLRAWIGADVPMPAIVGRLNVSLLQSYDSGLPYSAAGAINVTRYAGAPANPGYASIPNGLYYFSDRGAFRTDDIRSTSLAVRYARNIAGNAELFAQGDLLNVFNEHRIADPSRLGTGVTTAATSTTLQPFNPFTDTPVEGMHYQRAANFGQPLNNLAYQPPRTVRLSFGFRF
ncbi:MAG TPA: TonB-dependent receptor [Thermoanaerobaculia bacterium]|nr:TonB-dependent receptor [Thermoanaerobaculia bacterium]